MTADPFDDDVLPDEDGDPDVLWPLPDVLPRGISLSSQRNKRLLKVQVPKHGYISTFHRKYFDLAVQCLEEGKQLTSADDLPLLRGKFAELKLQRELGQTIPLTKFAAGNETDKSKKLAREYKDEPETRGAKAKPWNRDNVKLVEGERRPLVRIDELTEPPPQASDPAEAALVKAYRLERVARRARKEADSAWVEAAALLEAEKLDIGDRLWRGAGHEV